MKATEALPQATAEGVVREPLSKEEGIRLYYAIMCNNMQGFKKGFSNKDCNQVYDKNNGVWWPSTAFAAELQAWDFIPELAKRGADPNVEFKGSTPLHHFVATFDENFADPENAEKLTTILDAFAETGIDTPNRYGATPLQEAVLMNKPRIADYLCQKGAQVDFTDKPSLKDLQSIYNNLEKKITKEYRAAEKEGKKFLLVVGEEHWSYESKLMQAMMIDIVHRLGIKDFCIELHPDALSGQVTIGSNIPKTLDHCTAKAHGMTITAVDANRTFTALDFTDEGITLRDKGMCKKISELKHSCMLSVGNQHVRGIALDSALQAQYHICAITTSKESLLSRPDDSQFTKERTKYLQNNCTPAYLPGNLMKSKSIIGRMSEVIKSKDASNILTVFTNAGIFKADSLQAQQYTQSTVKPPVTAPVDENKIAKIRGDKCKKLDAAVNSLTGLSKKDLDFLMEINKAIMKYKTDFSSSEEKAGKNLVNDIGKIQKKYVGENRFQLRSPPIKRVLSLCENEAKILARGQKLTKTPTAPKVKESPSQFKR